MSRDRPDSNRLREVDALRGIAALSVVMFHYTTRYNQLYVHTSDLPFAVPWGHLGVNLFFMISGFVIFMTIEKTKHPMDFVASRLSRLYPVYWAAVWVTWLTVLLLGLPGKTVGFTTAVANMLMFHGLFHVKHVDGVYWTLEVELLFYCLMLALWSAGLLRRTHVVAALWLGLRLVYLGAEHYFGIELPYIISRFLILQFSPYFVIGMIVYAHARRGRTHSSADGILVSAALLTIAVGEGWQRGLIAAFLAGLLAVAVFRPPAILRWRVLLWLGAISYPLYLIHENIGWSLILALESNGVAASLSAAVATAVALAVATLLHNRVEMPAMSVLRRRYRQAHNGYANAWSRGAWTMGVVGVVGLILMISFISKASPIRPPQGLEHLGDIQVPRTPSVSCEVAGARQPLVIVALGQSNAANHGQLADPSPEVTYFFDGRCYRSGAPLAGGTGIGGSIWPWLASEIAQSDPWMPVLVATLAVDSSEVDAWAYSGPLQIRLVQLLRQLLEAGLRPDVVIWQQGEADAKLGTTAEDYVSRFRSVANTVRKEGVEAPILVARSTFCRGSNFGVVRRAQFGLTDNSLGIYRGPDTDSLIGDRRFDDCHFSEEGLREAAKLWLLSLREIPAFQNRFVERRSDQRDDSG